MKRLGDSASGQKEDKAPQSPGEESDTRVSFLSSLYFRLFLRAPPCAGPSAGKHWLGRKSHGARAPRLSLPCLHPLGKSRTLALLGPGLPRTQDVGILQTS